MQLISCSSICLAQKVTIDKNNCQDISEAQCYIKNAQNFYDKKKLNDAIELLQQAVKVHSDFADLYSLLAIYQFRTMEEKGLFEKYSLAKEIRKNFELSVLLDRNNPKNSYYLQAYYLFAPFFLGGSNEKANELNAQIKGLKKQIGIKYYLFFGKEYEQNGDAESKKLLVEIAERFLKGVDEEYLPAFRIPVERQERGEKIMSADSLKAINPLIKIYKMTGENRYLDIALNLADKVTSNNMNEDGSCYRAVLLDKEGKVISKHMHWVGDKLKDEPQNRDIEGQALLIKGLYDLFENTGKYKDRLDKAIDCFLNITENDTKILSDRGKQYVNALSDVIGPLIRYGNKTGNKILIDKANQFIKNLIKDKLRLNDSYQGLIEKEMIGTDKKSYRCSLIRSDWEFMEALGELNKDREKRKIYSGDMQAGFTNLEGFLAEEQSAVEVNNDEDKIKIRIYSKGANADKDEYTILIGEKQFRLEKEDMHSPGVFEKEIYLEDINLDKKETSFNILRTRGNEFGKRKTFSSWSENYKDEYFSEKRTGFSVNEEHVIGKGILILK